MKSVACTCQCQGTFLRRWSYSKRKDRVRYRINHTVAEEKTYIQQVVGTFLYYARAVDPTMLVALNAIAADQAVFTKNTLEKVDPLLDYAALQEDAVITYHASDMVLAIHSDASCLPVGAKSQKQSKRPLFHVK